MSSDARRQASQENGRLSGGPATATGKQRSARNAIKHGLCSERFLVADEDGDEFSAFRASIWRDLSPRAGLEEALAERVVGALWRLRRAVRVENDVLARAGVAGSLERFFSGRKAGGRVGSAFERANPATMDRIARYEVRLERSLVRALAELERARAGSAERQAQGVDVAATAEREEDFGDARFVSQSVTSEFEEPSLADLVPRSQS